MNYKSSSDIMNVAQIYADMKSGKTSSEEGQSLLEAAKKKKPAPKPKPIETVVKKIAALSKSTSNLNNAVADNYSTLAGWKTYRVQLQKDMHVTQNDLKRLRLKILGKKIKIKESTFLFSEGKATDDKKKADKKADIAKQKASADKAKKAVVAKIKALNNAIAAVDTALAGVKVPAFGKNSKKKLAEDVWGHVEVVYTARKKLVPETKFPKLKKEHFEMRGDPLFEAKGGLSGSALVNNLTTICLASWYELIKRFNSKPDVYDINAINDHESYMTFKMTPGLDVKDKAYEAIAATTNSIAKALNNAFDKEVFEARLKRDGGSLETLVGFVASSGGVFQCKAEGSEAGTVIHLTMPNKNELLRAFSAMTDTPHPDNAPNDAIDGDMDAGGPVAGEPTPDVPMDQKAGMGGEAGMGGPEDRPGTTMPDAGDGPGGKMKSHQDMPDLEGEDDFGGEEEDDFDPRRARNRDTLQQSYRFDIGAGQLVERYSNMGGWHKDTIQRKLGKGKWLCKTGIVLRIEDQVTERVADPMHNDFRIISETTAPLFSGRKSPFQIKEAAAEISDEDKTDLLKKLEGCWDKLAEFLTDNNKVSVHRNHGDNTRAMDVTIEDPIADGRILARIDAIFKEAEEHADQAFGFDRGYYKSNLKDMDTNGDVDANENLHADVGITDEAEDLQSDNVFLALRGNTEDGFVIKMLDNAALKNYISAAAEDWGREVVTTTPPKDPTVNASQTVFTLGDDAFAEDVANVSGAGGGLPVAMPPDMGPRKRKRKGKVRKNVIHRRGAVAENISADNKKVDVDGNNLNPLSRSGAKKYRKSLWPYKNRISAKGKLRH